jgi:hypothetical protein
MIAIRRLISVIMRHLPGLLLVLALPALPAQRDWNFRVLLEGREIGQHRFSLRETGGTRELRSEASFDVRWLFINAYRYRHEALERWQGDCLRSLAAQTLTNGREQVVKARAEGDGLIVEHTKGRDAHEGCVMSFAYWNPKMLQARRLLNSQTGELIPVQITPRGEETLAANGKTLATQRYRVTAPKLQIDLWYADGHWVALEALTGGKRLRYELI